MHTFGRLLSRSLSLSLFLSLACTLACGNGSYAQYACAVRRNKCCMCVCVCAVSCAACYVCSFGICEFLKSNGIDGTSHKTDNEIHRLYVRLTVYINIYMDMYKYVYMSFLRQNEQECEIKLLWHLLKYAFH